MSYIKLIFFHVLSIQDLFCVGPLVMWLWVTFFSVYIYRIVKNSIILPLNTSWARPRCVWSVTRLFNSRQKKNPQGLCVTFTYTEFKNVCWCQSEWAGNGGRREEWGGLRGGQEDDGPGIPARSGCPPQNPPRLWGNAGKVHT